MICRATAGVTCCATGIGWYGEPCQHGWDTPAVHSRIFCCSRASLMPSRCASRVSSGMPPPGCCETSARFTETTREVWLSTSGWPVSSRIWPRTGGTITVLTWSWVAALA